MMWLAVIVLGFLALAVLEDVHTKWHERQMVELKSRKDIIYS